jgi:hypothetical protein
MSKAMTIAVITLYYMLLRMLVLQTNPLPRNPFHKGLVYNAGVNKSLHSANVLPKVHASSWKIYFLKDHQTGLYHGG